MINNEPAYKTLVYELMTGIIDLNNYPVIEGEIVENEYERGRFCEIAYNEVYEANRRICKRLGVEEDKDVECIINNLLSISKYLSIKMYDYGSYFSHPSMR